jgi:hypothetical protein
MVSDSVISVAGVAESPTITTPAAHISLYLLCINHCNTPVLHRLAGQYTITYRTAYIPISELRNLETITPVNSAYLEPTPGQKLSTTPRPLSYRSF